MPNACARKVWKPPLPLAGAWGVLGEQLLPLRMPLFFTISGMFALSAVHRPWRVLARTRIANLAYLYVLWLLIHTAIMWFTPAIDTARARDLGTLVEQLTISPTNLWYLYALALYFTLARLTRRIPTPWLLGAAFLFSALAATELMQGAGNRDQVFQNLFFFLAGLRLRPAVERIAARSNLPGFLLAGTAYAAGLAFMALLNAQQWFGVWPAVSALATCFGVIAAVLISRHLERLTQLLVWLGRRTLPIYVIHMPLLAVVSLLLQGPLEFLEPRGTLTAALEPVVLTAVLMAVCLILHRASPAVGLSWMFERPHMNKRMSTAR
jgi:uncharacterized membrane protein YcfT